MTWQAFVIVCIIGGQCQTVESIEQFADKHLCTLFAKKLVREFSAQVFPRIVDSNFKCVKAKEPGKVAYD